MALMHIAPKIDVQADRISGCTSGVAQFLLLFFYSRAVTVDRRKQRVAVTTRWFWLWNVERSIPFDRVARIVYRAQGLPSLSLARYLSLRNTDMCDSAIFYIA